MSSDDSEYEFDDDFDIDSKTTQVLSSEGGNIPSLVSSLCESDRKINERLLVERSLFGDAGDNAKDESSNDESEEDDDDLDWDDESDNQSSTPFVEQCANETSEVDMIEEERVANKEFSRQHLQV